jgi:hypothetical protein
MSDRTNSQYADEWTEGDRNTALELIRKGRATAIEAMGHSQEELAQLLAKAQIALEIEWQAKRECARRYLDATGRGEYGSATLEHEIDLFERIGQRQIIFQNRPNQTASSKV